MFKKKIIGLIAVLVAILLATGCDVGGLAASTYNATESKDDYSDAVKSIMAEDYEQALETLENLDADDSEGLYLYVLYQLDIDSYKGTPEKMLDDISYAEGKISNDDVLHQCENAKREIESAMTIQEEIDSLDTSSADNIESSTLESIKEQTNKLYDRYRKLLSLDKYTLAVETLTAAEEKAAEEKAEQEKLATEKEEAERKAAEEKAEQERLAAEAAAAQENEQMVWIPKSGSKYHRKSTCSNMKDPAQVTLQQAIDWGYEACKKCW